MTVNLPKIGQRGRVVVVVIKKAQPLERAELFNGKSKSTSVYLMIFEISPVIFSISESLRAPLNA
jgi:hypothetical protein